MAEKKPIITALNKIDLLQDNAWLSWLKDKFPNSVCISAKTGQNLNQLIKNIETFLKPRMRRIKLSIPLNKMGIVDLLYRQAKVEKIEYEAHCVRIQIKIDKDVLSNILKNKEVSIIN